MTGDLLKLKMEVEVAWIRSCRSFFDVAGFDLKKDKSRFEVD